jgi:hypothetical protein
MCSARCHALLLDDAEMWKQQAILSEERLKSDMRVAA